MKKINATIMVSLLVTIGLNNTAMADTAQMDATLQRISNILNLVNPLINTAEAEQNPNARVQFQFNALRQDIARVQSGIAEAVKHVSVQPRQVMPLEGDYLPAQQINQEGAQ